MPENKNTSSNEYNITFLLNFIEKDYGSQGFDDAIINPDLNFKEQNIQYLKNQLYLTIKKVKMFYENFLYKIDFHIDSKSLYGDLIIVEELKAKKREVENYLQHIAQIEEDAKDNNLYSQAIFVSYNRGFLRGLTAIKFNSK